MIPEMIPDYTLCYILSKDHILLGMKKRRFGESRWNGFGGRIEAKDSSIEAGAVREIKEEVGLIVKENNLERVGEILFFFTEKPVFTFIGLFFYPFFSHFLCIWRRHYNLIPGLPVCRCCNTVLISCLECLDRTQYLVHIPPGCQGIVDHRPYYLFVIDYKDAPGSLCLAFSRHYHSI